MDVLLTAGAVVSAVSVVPLGYLALRSVREARELRGIQYELAGLMREVKDTGEKVHELQHEIRREQVVATKTIEETKRTVDQTAEQVTDVVEQAAGHLADGVADRGGRGSPGASVAGPGGLAGRIGAALSLLR